MSVSVPGLAALSGAMSYGHYRLSQLTGEQSGRAGGYNNAVAYDSVGNPTRYKGVADGGNAADQSTATTYDADGVRHEGAQMIVARTQSEATWRSTASTLRGSAVRQRTVRSTRTTYPVRKEGRNREETVSLPASRRQGARVVGMASICKSSTKASLRRAGQRCFQA